MKTGEKPLWEVFPVLTAMVRQDHRQKETIKGGHDFLHALITAQYGEKIAENKRIGVLAWVAGICHNTDRLFPLSEIEGRLGSYLKETGLSDEEKELVFEAIMNHSEPNDPNDNPVTVALKDADRLSNIGPNLLIRSGLNHPNIPAYDPHYILTSDPSATYRNPKTVLDDIKFCLEWEQWLRLPKAKKLAKPYFRQLRTFIKLLAKQLQEVDLLPYPFGEVE